MWFSFFPNPNYSTLSWLSGGGLQVSQFTMETAKFGMKRQSPVWDFFEYECERDRSKCRVVETGDKICRVLLKGKNPTNLKVHLKSAHKKANCEYLDKLVSQTSCPEQKPLKRPGGTGKEATIMDSFHRRPSCWLVNTQEHHKRDDTLINMFIETGLSTRLCDSVAFKKFCISLEPKFNSPGAARLNNLMGAKMEQAKLKLKEIIKHARKLTLCVDGWSKRGLTASFFRCVSMFSLSARSPGSPRPSYPTPNRAPSHQGAHCSVHWHNIRCVGYGRRQGAGHCDR